jgi:carnosine N-methyltransferase
MATPSRDPHAALHEQHQEGEQHEHHQYDVDSEEEERLHRIACERALRQYGTCAQLSFLGPRSATRRALAEAAASASAPGGSRASTALEAREAAARGRILAGLRAHAIGVERCVAANQRFLSGVVDAHSDVYDNNDGGGDGKTTGKTTAPKEEDEEMCSPGDADKVRSTLRQVARDWSEAGRGERDDCYAPLLSAVEKYVVRVDASPDERASVRVLCPGSGLGRLPFEFVRRGLSAQGNEFSMFMLLTGNYLLNHSQRAEQWSVFPWATQVSNVHAYGDALREVSVPDVSPSIALQELAAMPDFDMCAGEFVEVYRGQAEAFHAVATCFFIDTAHDVVDYISVIFGVLAEGGVWANIGPLLWHYEDMPGEHSVELPWEAVRDAIVDVGFVFLEEEFPRPCRYADNDRAMMHTTYDCVFFVVQKPRSDLDSGSGGAVQHT